MRRLFTTTSTDLTKSALEWSTRTGQARHVLRSVYAEGPEDPTPLDRARAKVLVSSGREARGGLAGVLHKLDGVVLDDRPTRRTPLAADRVVTIEDTRCADGLQTMIDLASTLDDARWEQALESALRKKLVTIAELEAVAQWTPGRPRMQRVLAGRPAGSPPTESLLETLALQLARPILGEPVRQHVVRSPHGTFIARVDLSWPSREVFFELDGEGHKDQPVYDAARQTAVVAVTGWLPGRFTWSEITRIPVSTQRRFIELREQSDRRRRSS